MCSLVCVRFLRTPFAVCVLLAGMMFAVDARAPAQNRNYPAIVQSLATGRYQPATVMLQGNRATISFSGAGRIILTMEQPNEEEPEEILGYDQQHQYWAIYIDWSAKAVPLTPVGV